MTYPALLGVACYAALVAGCGAPQPSVDFSNPVSYNAMAVEQRRDILFSTGESPDYYAVFEWSYPRGGFIKMDTGGGTVGMCSDGQGNAWSANPVIGALDEWSHSGEIKSVLGDNYGAPYGCSIDRPTDNLAAATVFTYGTANYGRLVVYQNEGGVGTEYPTNLSIALFCGYDARGNLFADGLDSSDNGRLVELPKGAARVRNITLDASLDGRGAVQWDGQDLAVQAGQADHTILIYRVHVVGSKGTVASTVRLLTGKHEPFNGAQFWIQGNTIMEAVNKAADDIEFWHYPAGGMPFRVQRGMAGSKKVIFINGLTVSVAPKT